MARPYPPNARKLSQLACLAFAGLIIVSILLWPVHSRASQPAHLCDAAARQAASRHNVPLDVLRTVALVESGRTRAGRMEPWPWAIHAQGQGQWFNSRTDALAYAQSRVQAGHRNVDLGCFQINYRWHGRNFTSLDAMLDPSQNADYAARLLSQHKARLGAWDLAAGAYHSATPHHAQRYMARYHQLHAQVGPALQARTPDSRHNWYSLLTPLGTAALGSILPISERAQSARLIDLVPGRP